MHFLVMSPYSCDFLWHHCIFNFIMVITVVDLMGTWFLDSELSTCSSIILAYKCTVELIFNLTHTHTCLLNYLINISIYSLINCEYSKEQWRIAYSCSYKLHTKCTRVECTSANLLVNLYRIYSYGLCSCRLYTLHTCMEYTRITTWFVSLPFCVLSSCLHYYLISIARPY